MLRRTPHFREFGEIYFNSIYRDVMKGWHRHADITLNYACVWAKSSWCSMTTAQTRRHAAS